jgi:hypothetical protein
MPGLGATLRHFRARREWRNDEVVVRPQNGIPSRNRLARFLINRGVIVDTAPGPRSRTREWLWAGLALLVIAGVLGFLGLNILLFGSGFTDDPLKYLAAVFLIAVALICLALLIYGIFRRIATRGEAVSSVTDKT